MEKWTFSAVALGLLVLLSGNTGCTPGFQGQTSIFPSGLSWLQDTPVAEIASSRLTCGTHPEIVDGNLATIATFEVQGVVKKRYGLVGGMGRNLGKGQYITDFDGTIRCEILIKLDAPIYVTTVEVYPASRIPNLALSTTLEESVSHLGQSGRGFKPVHDKQHRDVEGTKPIKFQVERELLYLRVTADAIEDRQNATRRADEQIDIPLKGAAIREVKLYGREHPQTGESEPIEEAEK